MSNLPTLPSQPADPAILRGDGRYGFTARIEGDDLVVAGVRATWFGGAHDPDDNGQTASGVSTRRHPDLLGCALPMNGFRLTKGSPLPDLPWLSTTVEVSCPSKGRKVSVPLIDLGPAAPPHAHAAIDLTLAAFRALGGDPAVGSIMVDYRVRGGAVHLPATILSAARASLDEKQHPSAPLPAISAARPSRENGGLPPTIPAGPAVFSAPGGGRPGNGGRGGCLRGGGDRSRRSCRPPGEREGKCGMRSAECGISDQPGPRRASAAPCMTATVSCSPLPFRISASAIPHSAFRISCKSHSRASFPSPAAWDWDR